MKKIITIVFLYAGLVIGQENNQEIGWSANDLFLSTTELDAKIERLKNQTDPADLEIWYNALSVKYTRAGKTDKAIKTISLIQNDVIYAKSARVSVGLINSSNSTKWENLIEERLKRAEKKSLHSAGYYELAEVFGRVLLFNKKYKEALPYTKLGYENLPEEKVLSRNYHYLLSTNGYHKQALPKLEKLIQSGFADDEVKEQFRISFKSLYPQRNLEEYLFELGADLQADLSAKLVKMEVNKRVNPFTVLDKYGKEVSIQEFRGKVVVIDLWGTWCGPCMAALPAMQKVVNQHADDPTIKFMFINTLEKGDARAIAIDYFDRNNYDMDLYIDPMNPETKMSSAYEALGKGGMPNKIIIDADGTIRFKTAGFSGGNDELIEELNLMIKIAKSKKYDNKTY